MQSDKQFRHVRRVTGFVFAAVVLAVASLIVISIVFGRLSPPYPPFFFFGWWIFIPLLFFGFFFFFRFWWGWGYWWYPRRDYDPALEMLRERFARGEITKEQYEQMKRDLES
ncbi:MAG: SHOCT domain-containing protein [Nitrososphaerales archaeon]